MSQERRSQSAGSPSGPRPNTPDYHTAGQVAGGAGVTGLLLARLRQQHNAGTGRSSPVPSSRLGALQAAAKFKGMPGSVGSGVYSGISAIHMILGNTMQAHIGDVFRSSKAQQLMAQPAGGLPSVSSLRRTPMSQMGQGFGPANWALASGEHSYWGAQMRNMTSSVMGQTFPPAGGVGNQIGGAIGTAFRPVMRATAQSIAARNPYLFPVIAVAGMVSGSAWAGGHVGSTVGRRTGSDGVTEHK